MFSPSSLSLRLLVLRFFLFALALQVTYVHAFTHSSWRSSHARRSLLHKIQDKISAVDPRQDGGFLGGGGSGRKSSSFFSLPPSLSLSRRPWRPITLHADPFCHVVLGVVEPALRRTLSCAALSSVRKRAELHSSAASYITSNQPAAGTTSFSLRPCCPGAYTVCLGHRTAPVHI